MTMKDIGIDMGEPAYETKETKKYYPRLSVTLDEFPELNEIGREATLVIKVRVKSITDNDNGGCIDLEVFKAGLASEKPENKAEKSYTKLRGRI